MGSWNTIESDSNRVVNRGDTVEMTLGLRLPER